MGEAEKNGGIERLHLRDVLFVLRRYLFFLLAFPSACACLGVGILHSITPISYQANISMLVGPIMPSADNAITYDRLLATAQLAVTDVQVLKSNIVLQQVKKNLRLPMSDADLLAHVSVQHIQQTGVLILSASANTPDLAVKIVREWSLVASDQVAKLTNAGTIRSISYPEADKAPKRLGLWTVGGICYLFGWTVAVLGVLFHASWKKGYGTVKEMQERTGLPVLGALPHACTKF